MSKPIVIFIAVAAFIVPVAVVLCMNQDKLFEEDLSSGRLLYFTAPN